MNHTQRRIVWTLFLLICLQGSQAYSADKWLSVRSKNFLLVGNAGEGEIRRVGRNLEQFRAAFALLFPSVKQDSSIGTTVIVFSTDDSFKPYKPLYEGKPATIAGFFQPGEDVNFIAVTASLNSQSVIFHEYVHSLIKDLAGGLPLWASEGLAEFYSTFEMSGNSKEVTLGRAIGRHVTTLSENQFIPLGTFFAVDHGSPYYNEKFKQGIFYAQSWAVAHYLMLGADQKHRPQFAKYLALVGSGKSVQESFTESFQTNYETLEKEIREYIRGRMTWPAIKVALKDSLDVDKDMKTTPLSEAQSQYYLGDFLLHTERTAEAAAHLQKAISLDANIGAAYASLGMLRMREKQYIEALSLLKRAVDADSRSHIVHYYYAQLIQQLESEGELPEAEMADRHQTMRTQLTKSIELNPSFVESYALLAYVNLTSGEQLEETEPLLRKALSISPGRHDLTIWLAQVLLQKNNVASGRALLAPLAKNAADPAIRKRAASILDQIELYTRDQEAIRQSLTRRETRAPEPPRDTSTPPEIRRTPIDPMKDRNVVEEITPQKPRIEGDRLTGLLTSLDCSKGMTLRVRTENGMAEFHTDSPQNLEFVSYVAAISNTITCGPRNPAIPVTITYRKSTNTVSRFLGEPLVVEFIEKK